MATKAKSKKTALPTTWEEVCEIKNIDPISSLPDVSGMPEEFKSKIIATAKLFIITDCLNTMDGGSPFNPDWNNWEQHKYFPWFYMNNPGFRFYCSDGCGAGAYAGSGSWLCFRTRALSDFAGNTFEDIYKDAMIF